MWACGRRQRPWREFSRFAKELVRRRLMETRDLENLYRRRGAASRWRRTLLPPAPFGMNPGEPNDFPLGRWNLYIGGAGRPPAGYVNLDLFPMPGVDVAADAEALP